MVTELVRSSVEDAPVPSTLSYYPRLIQNECGEIIGVILAYADYQRFLRLLVSHEDRESLPPHLQDAVDNMLADEALAEGGPSRPLRELLAETGE
jgi:hypothetical protein